MIRDWATALSALPPAGCLVREGSDLDVRGPSGDVSDVVGDCVLAAGVRRRLAEHDVLAKRPVHHPDRQASDRQPTTVHDLSADDTGTRVLRRIGGLNRSVGWCRLVDRHRLVGDDRSLERTAQDALECGERPIVGDAGWRQVLGGLEAGQRGDGGRTKRLLVDFVRRQVLPEFDQCRMQRCDVVAK